DQALASVSGRLVSLPAPPSRSGRRWLVPVEFIARALGLIYDARLDLRKPARLLVVGDLRVPPPTVAYGPPRHAARLTIDAAPAATPRAASPGWRAGNPLTIRCAAAAPDGATPPMPPPGPQSLATAVRVVDATTIAVDLGPRFNGFRSTSQQVDTAARLAIDLV